MTDKIYKYVDIVGLECILKNGTLKFTKPEDFNDPFEFHDSLVERELSYKHWLEIIKKKIPDISTGRLKQLIDIFTHDKSDFIEEMNLQFQNREESTRISCFSMVNDSLLMWSHYSDKHKGACIEFSKDELIENFKYDFQVLEINYSDIIESKNISMHREKAISHWISTKAKEWAYEKEVRLVFGSNPQEIKEINVKSIKHVFLGSKMLDEEKDRIERLIFDELNYTWIKISEMKISKTEFKLEINNRR